MNLSLPACSLSTRRLNVGSFLARAFLALLCALSWELPVALSQAAIPPFPDRISLDGEELVLNGSGVRKATIFRVKVYAAALFVAKRTSSADELLSGRTTKQVHMRFLRDVSKEKLGQAWRDGLAANSNLPASSQGAFDSFIQSMRDVSEGDELVITLKDGSVAASLNGALLTRVSDGALTQQLLAVWVGPQPPNEDLKSGLLGLTE